MDYEDQEEEGDCQDCGGSLYTCSGCGEEFCSECSMGGHDDCNE